MAESEQIWWTYVKIENVAEIYSARIDSSNNANIASINAEVIDNSADITSNIAKVASNDANIASNAADIASINFQATL